MRDLQTPAHEFIPSGRLPAVSPADDVLRAISLMNESKAGCVLVEESNALVGIFTERDFLRRVFAPNRPPADIRVGEVMTVDPDWIRRDDEIAFAVNRMAVGEYRNVPVVNDEGEPIGLISVHDVVELLAGLFDERGDEESEFDFESWTDTGGG